MGVFNGPGFAYSHGMQTEKEKAFRILVLAAATFGTLYVMSPFLAVILLAAVIAFALDPFVEKFKVSNWYRMLGGVYFLMTMLFLSITIPFLTVFYKLYSMFLQLDLAGEGRKNLMAMVNQNKSVFTKTLNDFLAPFGMRKSINIDSMIGDAVQQAVNYVITGATYAVTQIPDILFTFAVFMVALFFFVHQSARIKRVCLSSELLSRADTRRVIVVLKETSYSAVFSSILTGILQALIVASGGALLAEVDFMLFFIITFFVSFIPIVGAAPVALVLALYAWAQIGAGPALGLLAIAVVAGVADNILRVFLLKVVKDDLHPVVSLMAIIGGIIVFGLPGLFLGPVIVATTFKIVPEFLDIKT